MKKIAFTGPESTGKTYLAGNMASNHGCIWVPEYAREYLEARDGFYRKSDLLHILDGQLVRMEFAEQAETPYIFYDTEILVLKVWYEFLYGEMNIDIEQAWQEQEMDHYFLCDIDIPWEADPLREHPDHRKELFNIYKDLLENYNRPYTILSGSLKERVRKVERLLHL